MTDKNERRLLKEEDPVFGHLRPLKKTQPMKLPTYEDVGQALAFERAKHGCLREKGGGRKCQSNESSYNKIVEDLIFIHEEGNIPTTPRGKIKDKLLRLWGQVRYDKMKEKPNKTGKKKNKWGKQRAKYEDIEGSAFSTI